MWSILAKIGGAILGSFGKSSEAKTKINEAQTRVNEAEISGAPVSHLRLWRSFLGWVLALLFTWEVVFRLCIIPLFFQEWGATLPPSVLEQILPVLLTMLGGLF